MRSVGRSERMVAIGVSFALLILLALVAWPYLDGSWAQRVGEAFVAVYLDAATFLRTCF